MSRNDATSRCLSWLISYQLTYMLCVFILYYNISTCFGFFCYGNKIILGKNIANKILCCLTNNTMLYVYFVVS